ncbi:hypothetical protein M9H77_25826 [Catharanthus roseus]|uniref:Uncharacterized protein n=1 Tax=Catharanthus roseus TaxID=4058 RepID=A0ACC0AAK5_CATRO|nr:hypothetical protein M9H77_25826 [Catharanthus roseus]
MEEIQHKYVTVNDGLKLHAVEIGSGPSVVLFCHGFPEIWYTWRHQMVAMAKAGYRAISFDYRGYGLSDQPPEPEKATFLDLISDILALVFIVGKDFGASVANLFAVLHKKRVSAVVTLGLPFIRPAPTSQLSLLPEGYYVRRWMEPGRAEADFGRFDAKTVVRNIYILFSRNEMPLAKENEEIMDLVKPSTPLPPWITEEELAIYGALYEKSGFRTALKVTYRSFGETPNIKDPKIEVPALLIMGEEDSVFRHPGMEDYIRSGEVEAVVPNLEVKYIPEGSHFVQEQFPDLVNELLLSFISSHEGSEE